MARGAKDCSELGRLVFESIKDDHYAKCELTPQAKFIALVARRATRQNREQLGIHRGNGTVATLYIDGSQKFPRFDRIARDLPRHFALRDILAENSPTKLTLRNVNRRDEEESLVYGPPLGEIVFDEVFAVEPYGVTAHLRILRAPEPFDDDGERDRFRRSGFLIKAVRAIHECTLFSQEFERDPLAKKYFGRVECEYIDVLLREYDKRREAGLPSLPENPALLIDPNRQRGLNRDHPFTKALFLTPMERLRAVIAADRENQRVQKREISNRETQARLSRLAKKATEFLKQQLEDVQLSNGEEFENSAFKNGTLIFPPFLNLAVGQERTLTYYVKTALLDRVIGDKVVRITANSTVLTVIDSTVEIKPHKSKEDRYLGTFRLRGDALQDNIEIRAVLDGLPPASATVSIKDKSVEQHVFEYPLEFEYREYRVREGSRRSLQLYAKYPEVVVAPTTVAVESRDISAIAIRGTCTLAPVAGTNYATGTVIVQGRKLHAKAEVNASANGRTAIAQARVVQSPPESGVDIKIELRDEDYGKFRALWADREQKPNLLLVSARHKSVSRYLGPGPEFEGQNSPLFRVLLAEIVAESVARRALVLECKERTRDFRWADLKEDHLIADDVFTNLQQRIRDFVADAHEIMLTEAEIRKEGRESIMKPTLDVPVGLDEVRRSDDRPI
jgi:hypothetical protein